jgi:hypothetical protein
MERFVRTLLVEALHKVIELGLLLKKVPPGRLGGFFFRVGCMRSWRWLLMRNQ